MKVDSGAEGNTIPLRIVDKMYPNSSWKDVASPTKTKLTAYNGTPIPCVGFMQIACRFNAEDWTTHKFFIVDVEGPAVLGWKSSSDLQVISVNELSKVDVPHITDKED